MLVTGLPSTETKSSNQKFHGFRLQSGKLGMFERHPWHPFQPFRERLAADLRAMRCSAHLDKAEGIFPIVGAEIIVADRKCLLEDGVIGFAHQGHENRLV